MKFHRRKFLHLTTGAAALPVAMAAGSALAAQRVKGPLVWLDMDQKDWTMLTIRQFMRPTGSRC